MFVKMAGLCAVFDMPGKSDTVSVFFDDATTFGGA